MVSPSKKTRYILGGIGAIVVLFLVIFLPVWFLVVDVDNKPKIDCFPEKDATRTECEDRGCIFEPTQDPVCFFPPNTFGYKSIVTSQPDGKFVSTYESLNEKPLIDTKYFQEIQATTSFISGTHGRLKIVPLKGEGIPRVTNRWQVPFNHPTELRNVPSDAKLKFSHDPTLQAEFNGDKIIDLVDPLLFEDQYMQFSTKLPAKYDFYGLGEADKTKFKLETQKRTRMTIWAAGQPVKPDANLYGQQVSIFIEYFKVEFRELLHYPHGILITKIHFQTFYVGVCVVEKPWSY